MIEFRDVSHVYRRLPNRATRAVDGFSLTINPGEILGIAGPNGAGKTTLISMLLGYIRPTSGLVQIDGLAPRTYVERNGIGYLPELVVINREWKTEDALRRLGTLEGMPPAHLAERLSGAIKSFDLADHRRKLVRELSKGTLQRVGLAQAMLCDHAIAIFDEPTHGLDPVWTYRFRDLVEAFRRPDRAILIASHNLDELQRLADRVVIIDRGRVQRVVDLRASAGEPVMPYQLEVSRGAELVGGIFPGAQPLGANMFVLPEMDAATLNAGLVRLIGAGALIAGVARGHSSLESQFREAVRQ